MEFISLMGMDGHLLNKFLTGGGWPPFNGDDRVVEQALVDVSEFPSSDEVQSIEIVCRLTQLLQREASCSLGSEGVR